MIEVQQTAEFIEWLDELRDEIAQDRIGARITKAQGGHFGDVKSLGDKVSEMRIDHGPGYRIYFTRRGRTIILLLIGGDKGSQDRDIRKAKEMAAALR